MKNGFSINKFFLQGLACLFLLASAHSVDRNEIRINGEPKVPQIHFALYDPLKVLEENGLDFQLSESKTSLSQTDEEQFATYAKKNWMVRYSDPSAHELMDLAGSGKGFSCRVAGDLSEMDALTIYIHLKLEGAVQALSFNYELKGDATRMPIELLDAAGKVLWRYTGVGPPPEDVELEGLDIRGQLVFRINLTNTAEIPVGWSHGVSRVAYAQSDEPIVRDKDGFILLDKLSDLRGYAGEDNVKIRLKPGVYQIDKAFCKQFIEFSGNNSHYDLTGARIMVDTRLFTLTSLAPGIFDGRLYAVMGLSGDNISMEGPYIENYGNNQGIQSRNKIFNITGSDITLKNAEIRTSGSAPWGYGSLYGISGGDVRKMNGIRIAWPANNVKLIGCKVHMRAMGHAIFVQGAKNTLIEDCHVDGLLRTTDEVLTETSGYSFDRNFKAPKGGYIEGVTVADDGSILPGEMMSLSEDGIRMYPGVQGNDEGKTGSTTIKDCTVTNMRRGICTGLSSAGDKVINCKVTNTVATGFNVGNADTLINCSADAKYAEALCIPYINARNAVVDLEILDSRGGVANDLLAKINGIDHKVKLRTSNNSYIPENLVIKLSTKEGYGGPRGNDSPSAINIQLSNETAAEVMLLPGTVSPDISGTGKVGDLSHE